MPAVEASELVKDLELKTVKHGKCTKHFFYQRGSSGRDRRIQLAEEWRRERRLGRGAFGEVYLERCEKMVRKDVPNVRAVKEIRVEKGSRVDFTRELEAIAKFSHNRFEPCFVRCFGWFQDEHSISITMEYIRHGNLREHLKVLLPEKEANIITRQLVEGLGYMHRNRFVHRDLKPENILVVHKGPNWLVQIADFGITRRLEKDRTIQGTMRQGTLGFIAPEMMGFIAEKRFPFAVDMWSLGAVVFRMLTGEQFLTEVDDLREFVHGELKLPTKVLTDLGVSATGLDFLSRLLVAHPKDRLTVAEADVHLWMAEFVDKSTPDGSTMRGAGSASGSVAGDAEGRESGLTEARSTSARETVESKPSAQWSDQATVPRNPVIWDDLGLSEDEFQEELESATLQLARTQVREAPHVPDAPGHTPTAPEKEEKHNDGPAERRSSVGRSRQQPIVIHHGKSEAASLRRSSVLDIASEPFGAHQDSPTPGTSEAASNDPGSDADRPPILQYATSHSNLRSSRKENSLGSKLESTLVKATAEETEDEELDARTLRPARIPRPYQLVFEAALEPVPEKASNATSRRSETLVNETAEPNYARRVESEQPWRRFISDGRTIWEDVLREPKKQVRFDEDYWPYGPPPPPPPSQPPRPYDGYGSSSTSDSLQESEEEDESSSPESETEKVNELPGSDYGLVEVPQPPNAIPHKGWNIAPPCYRCNGGIRLSGNWFRAKTCHIECQIFLCDECWALAIKDAFLTENHELPKCDNGLVLDYDIGRRSVNLDRIGNFYMAYKYMFETDEKHCCTNPECMLAEPKPLTRRRETGSGRILRFCTTCGARYCDDCLKQIDPDGSWEHGYHKAGRYCKTDEELADYIEELKYNPPRVADKCNRWFLDACAYITKAGGTIAGRYQKECA